MLEAVDQLIAVLKERGSERAVDMDDAAQRVSLEVNLLHQPAPQSVRWLATVTSRHPKKSVACAKTASAWEAKTGVPIPLANCREMHLAGRGPA